MNSRYSFAKRLIAGVTLACMTSQTVLAAATDISSTPLSSGTTPVQPNVLFILDDSGSMGLQSLPDYVESSGSGNPAAACPRSTTGLGFVPATTGASADCNAGDAAYYAGGASGFNGIYYDPKFNYLPGINANGTPVVPDAGLIANVYDLNTAALTPNAYLGGTNVNLTSSTFRADRQYCNINNLCKKNGETAAGALTTGLIDIDSRTGGSTFAMANGQFPYRAHKSNSSTALFGLPEVMAGATPMSPASLAVNTAEPHGLNTGDRVWAKTASGTVTANGLVQRNSPTNFQFGATVVSGEVVYRKHSTGTSTRALTVVTVTSPAHGLVVNDRISTFNHSVNAAANLSDTNVTAVVDANTFRYSTVTSGAIAPGTMTWVRNGLYNILSAQSNYPTYYTITPVEYCSDAALTTCDISTTLGTPPPGFSFPAYTRFCKTFADSIAPGAVSGSTGAPATARCQGKYIDGVNPSYVYPRFGLFTRTVIKSPGVASYPVAPLAKHPNRIDCLGATCTYSEEIQNYARWYTYYRTRMQMMKTAAGRAFLPFVSNPSATPPLPNKLRVGFITINPTGVSSPTYGVTSVATATKYLRIDNFDTTHATTWYSRLYSQVPGMSTPLREALSTAGWIYAGKMNTGLTKGIPAADDPVQASCQRNFSILTTDGYWNGNQGRDLSGAFMGNQDNVDNKVDAPYTEKMVSRDTGTYDGNFNAATAAVGTFGGSGTLADVALYYYRTDLRGSTTGPVLNLGGTGTVDVSPNNVSVKAGNKDFVTHQHMVTFTVGIVDGLMRYQSDYETATTGDFADIKNGATGCTFSTTATCNWPAPKGDHASALDDLWHSAVNSRGTFYSARDPAALSGGLSTALSALNAQVAAAAASATSSPNITQTDRQIFSTTYQTDTWAGKIVAQKIDASTGAVEPTIDWSAEVQLLAQVGASSDSRNIYTYTSGGDKVKLFKYADLDPTTEQIYFNSKCASFMTQCGTGPTPVPLVGTPLADANNGTKLVDYLRGQTGLEGVSFRDRRFIDPVTEVVTQTVLGDTINAKPAFVRNPLLNFGGLGGPSPNTYTEFKTTQTALNSNTGRSPRLYIGANDGYLHAFDGDTGSEAWAYLPKFLMPGLPALASYGYSTAHSYFVDGSPEATDVFDETAGVWKTILVGGLNGGGRGFYALDITSALAPKGLWEFCNDATLCSVPGATAAEMADMGLSYGNPVIGKRSFDGRWVVVVTSGLNNANADGVSTDKGDGRGYFFVLDAITGELLEKIGTGVGSVASPSGLMKISALFTSANTDPTFRYIYGGDQLGNVWRADLSVSPATIIKLATLKDASTPKRAQPITTRPVLTKIGTDTIVYVGTGRYIGLKDLTDQLTPNSAWQQTLYAFKDKGTDYGADLRSNTNMVLQTLTSLSPTTRGTSNNFPTDGWTTKDGWYMDFNPVFGGVAQSPGERINIDIELILGTLVVVTNVPIPASGVQCEIGGSSWLYQLDFKTGEYVANAPGGVAGSSLGSVITVGIAVVQLPSGAIKGIVTSADTSKSTQGVIIGGSAGSLRRFSYRER